MKHERPSHEEYTIQNILDANHVINLKKIHDNFPNIHSFVLISKFSKMENLEYVSVFLIKNHRRAILTKNNHIMAVVEFGFEFGNLFDRIYFTNLTIQESFELMVNLEILNNKSGRF